MKTIDIGAIDRVLRKTNPKSILLVCQVLERYKEEWNEDKREEETLLKLRNREDAFVTRVAQRGIRVTPMRQSELTAQKVSSDGPFDFAVIAGEITYQSFSIAAALRGKAPEIPIFIEFCEATFDTLAERLIAKNAKYHQVEDLLQNLVYLTAIPKQPRVINLEE